MKLKDISEKVAVNNLCFDMRREKSQSLIILVIVTQSIIIPEIILVLNDWIYEWDTDIFLRFVHKSLKGDMPFSQIITLIKGSHFSIIVWKNFNKVTHDVREECNTTKHDKTSDDHFDITDGMIVSITNSWKSCENKIEDKNYTGVIRVILIIIFCDECLHLLWLWFLLRRSLITNLYFHILIIFSHCVQENTFIYSMTFFRFILHFQ